MREEFEKKKSFQKRGGNKSKQMKKIEERKKLPMETSTKERKITFKGIKKKEKEKDIG